MFLLVLFVLQFAAKILDVKRAPINEIGHRSVRMNEMVDAPADFSGDSLHGIKLRVETLMCFNRAVKRVFGRAVFLVWQGWHAAPSASRQSGATKCEKIPDPIR